VTLLYLAQATAADDPSWSRALLDEAVQQATTLNYEGTTQLSATVFTAARLGAWTIVLRAASSVLHHQLRSGTVGVLWLAGIVNVAARGFAEYRPEPAAVLQGTVRALMRRLVPGVEASRLADAAPRPGAFGQTIAAVRHDTTHPRRCPR
jgi:hypothetical protein